MSTKVVETLTDDSGASLARTECVYPTASADLHLVEAGGTMSGTVCTGESAAVVSAVLSDIQARITAGESTPVLASHLDSLGLRDAVLAWATRGGQ